MKTISIYFADFWGDFNKEHNFIIDLLKKDYEVVLDSSNPQYLFYSSFGIEHFNYSSAVKIYFTGENDVPDFNLCDYGIGSSHISFEDRYFRLPLYCLYAGYEELFDKKLPVDKHVLERKFCNFIYSNAQVSDPVRKAFFERLSAYKKVDSGGRYLNNIGKAVDDKIRFIADYKFTIAFENSSLSGYTTEKLIDPMRVNSLPIYWGNPRVGEDFNQKSFVYLDNKEQIDRIIEEVIYLDKNDEAYLAKLNQAWVNKQEAKHWQRDLQQFLRQIIEQTPESSFRTSPYGFANRYRKKQTVGSRLLNSPFFKWMLK